MFDIGEIQSIIWAELRMNPRQSLGKEMTVTKQVITRETVARFTKKSATLTIPREWCGYWFERCLRMEAPEAVSEVIRLRVQTRSWYQIAAENT